MNRPIACLKSAAYLCPREITVEMGLFVQMSALNNVLFPCFVIDDMYLGHHHHQAEVDSTIRLF